MPGRPDRSKIASVASHAIERSIIGESEPLAVFFDYSCFGFLLESLRSAFPSPAVNAPAVKANPAAGLWRRIASQGLGAECASSGELELALYAGIPEQKIFYDSPVKSTRELIAALESGCCVNADNEYDIQRIDRWMDGKHIHPGYLGVRINPEIQTGRYEQTSTAVPGSKFGLPVGHFQALAAANPSIRKWITGLHVHSGSQGIPIQSLICSIQTVTDLAGELNDKSGFSIHTIDIGGGLPVKYSPEDEDISFEEYSLKLKESIPDLGRYRIVTEFGRRLFASPGWVISRVETVKESGNRRIALVHAGADLFLRAAYMGWYHDILVLKPDGSPKPRGFLPQDIAGPLCFSADYICRDRNLPPIEPGDWVVVRDAGAYTIGMWSFYNLRNFPPFFGYSKTDELELLVAPKTGLDWIRFWDAGIRD